MSDPPFQNPAVAATFATYPPNIRPKVVALRQLFFDTAAKKKTFWRCVLPQRCAITAAIRT